MGNCDHCDRWGDLFWTLGCFLCVYCRVYWLIHGCMRPLDNRPQSIP
jgi:hypothetical protein